jgi:hypothetical protein
MEAKDRKKEFRLGLAMMVAFIAVLVGMFVPLFGSHNGLQYLDALYNSISKGSADYIPETRKQIAAFQGTRVELDLDLGEAQVATQSAAQLNAAGAMVNVDGTRVKIAGDFGAVLNALLDDAAALYRNDGKAVEARYGIEGRRAIYNWWKTIVSMSKALTKNKQFKEAKMLDFVKSRAVETAYNYYGIEAQKISERWGVVAFSLVFYVVYTLWYGFGILYMFEGAGMRLEH